LLLGYKSQWQEEEIKIPEIINSNITTVDNIENLPGYRLGQYQIDFIFPENFEYKNEYLYNFQMNNIFHSFNIIKENEEFTENNVDSNDAFFEYEEYIKYNKNNLIEYRPYDANYFANANRTFELKINLLNSEKEFDSHKEKFSTFHYGISFTSPTKYTLYFRSTFELEYYLFYIINFFFFILFFILFFFFFFYFFFFFFFFFLKKINLSNIY